MNGNSRKSGGLRELIGVVVVAEGVVDELVVAEFVLLLLVSLVLLLLILIPLLLNENDEDVLCAIRCCCVADVGN